jgi:hypothetical protein
MNIKLRVARLEVDAETMQGVLYSGFVMVAEQDKIQHNAQMLNNGYTMEDLGNGFTVWKSPTGSML